MSSLDPPSSVTHVPSIYPRPFPPIHPHPTPTSPLAPPQLPLPPRPSNFSDTYSLSTHIIPAVYPRAAPDAPIPIPKHDAALNDSSLGKKERMKMVAERTASVFALRNDYVTRGCGWDSFRPPSAPALWNCINRYVRKDLKEGKGLTLFFDHTNGFPKEVRTS